ncbi:MAG TPA: SDR family oxidoreductase [Candidatus Hydrogenedentes bacterium]|nr:SDR family oxidoreductase [Candidatus Hydrogenedentota bacterium]
MSDIISLADKTALVTGAAKRLGRAIALALARAGAHIIVHYRASRDDAEETAAAIRAEGVLAWTISADLVQPLEVMSLFDRAAKAAGAIDFLINSASIFPASGLRDFSPESLMENVQINALAPILLARRMAEQNREGAIINLLDAMIADYDKKHVPYHLSKRMLHDATRMMALEFAPKLRVNGIAPGLALPPAGEEEGYLAALAHTNPLQRYGSEAGICEAALFLLRSGFVTGQVIFVDGGRHLRGSVYG